MTTYIRPNGHKVVVCDGLRRLSGWRPARHRHACEAKRKRAGEDA